MAVVKEGKIGNTIYRIHDDAYKNRTPEQEAETVRRIGEIISRSRMRRVLEAMEKEEKALQGEGAS